MSGPSGWELCGALVASLRQVIIMTRIFPNDIINFTYYRIIKMNIVLP